MNPDLVLAHFDRLSEAPAPSPPPPLRDQRHVVAMVDKLMALCDGLEKQLAAAHNQRAHLLEVALIEGLKEQHF